MEKALAALTLLLLFTLLTEHQSVNGQVFCRSQISLANEACTLRTFPVVRPTVRQQLNESSSSMTAAAAGGGYELQSRDGDEDDEGESEARQRHHRRHHRGDGEEDPYDTACCRRLMALDNSCVCQVVARLPVFMTAVRHVVKLTPVDGCHVSFECPGSF